MSARRTVLALALAALGGGCLAAAPPPAPRHVHARRRRDEPRAAAPASQPGPPAGGEVVFSGSCRSDEDCPPHRRCLVLRSVGEDGGEQEYGNCVPKDREAYPNGYPEGTVSP